MPSAPVFEHLLLPTITQKTRVQWAEKGEKLHHKFTQMAKHFSHIRPSTNHKSPLLEFHIRSESNTPEAQHINVIAVEMVHNLQFVFVP